MPPVPPSLARACCLQRPANTAGCCQLPPAARGPACRQAPFDPVSGPLTSSLPPSPQVRDYVYISDKAYDRRQILGMERSMLADLGYELTLPTTYQYLARLLKAAGVQYEKPLALYVAFCAELCLVDYGCLRFTATELAAAIMYVAMRAFNKARRPWGGGGGSKGGVRPGRRAGAGRCFGGQLVLLWRGAAAVNGRAQPAPKSAALGRQSTAPTPPTLLSVLSSPLPRRPTPTHMR